VNSFGRRGVASLLGKDEPVTAGQPAGSRGNPVKPPMVETEWPHVLCDNQGDPRGQAVFMAAGRRAAGGVRASVVR